MSTYVPDGVDWSTSVASASVDRLIDLVSRARRPGGENAPVPVAIALPETMASSRGELFDEATALWAELGLRYKDNDDVQAAVLVSYAHQVHLRVRQQFWKQVLDDVIVSGTSDVTQLQGVLRLRQLAGWLWGVIDSEAIVDSAYVDIATTSELFDVSAGDHSSIEELSKPVVSSVDSDADELGVNLAHGNSDAVIKKAQRDMDAHKKVRSADERDGKPRVLSSEIRVEPAFAARHNVEDADSKVHARGVSRALIAGVKAEVAKVLFQRSDNPVHVTSISSGALINGLLLWALGVHVDAYSGDDVVSYMGPDDEDIVWALGELTGSQVLGSLSQSVVDMGGSYDKLLRTHQRDREEVGQMRKDQNTLMWLVSLLLAERLGIASVMPGSRSRAESTIAQVQATEPVVGQLLARIRSQADKEFTATKDADGRRIR